MNTVVRKPRIALMGEFSAGKSTLSNLLLGARPLPEKVTATRLSPVWMSHGTDGPYRIDVDGTREPVELERLEGIDVEATRVIRLFFEADVLQVCDLIDFPGISDPNMSSDVWQRMLGEVDAVLWCTHATQAWRQSEAAVWETIPEAVRERSVLLVTRFDKLLTERDKYRVLARLSKETEGLFGATFPISLTEALAAGDDDEAFTKSGGGAFLEHLIPLIDELNGSIGNTVKSIYQMAIDAQPSDDIPAELNVAVEAESAPATTTNFAVSQADEVPAAKSEPAVSDVTKEDGPVFVVDSAEPVVSVESTVSVAQQTANDGPRILPKRVRPKAGAGSARPMRPVATGNVVTMDATPSGFAAKPSAAPAPNQLRSIFNADEEVEKDAATSS